MGQLQSNDMLLVR